MDQNKQLAYFQNLLGTNEEDPFTLTGIGSAAQKLSAKDTADLLNLASLKSLEEQAKNIKDYETKLATQKTNIDPLTAITAGLSDLFTGSKELNQLAAEKALEERALASAEEKKKELVQDLTRSQISLLEKNQRDQQKEEALKEASKFKAASLAMRPEVFTPGEKAADVAFGKEYQEFNAQGGFTGIDAKLKTLEGVVNALENDPNASSTLSTLLPERARKLMYPKTVGLEQQLQGAIQTTLKETLGGVFTEAEGKRILENAYDPALPASENLKKVRQIIDSTRQKALAKEEASRYFQGAGTLKGMPLSTSFSKSAPGDEMKDMNFKKKRLEELRARKGK